ncbi:unnamed protein product [Meganyctiphanes norvegica]|uniref:Protein quiver n=1 Tax=Meganyctiphanes norvegica TaxID=48144 RepID=A0AAV2RXN4_MEGNR
MTRFLLFQHRGRLGLGNIFCSSSHQRHARFPVSKFSACLILLLISLNTCDGFSCVQCSWEGGRGEETTDACAVKPPKPEPCSEGSSWCMTVRTYSPAEQDKRSLVSVVRSCSPLDMGWDCEKGKDASGQVAELCHDTCGWEGCNHAATNQHTTTILTLASFILIVARTMFTF